jgi:hypothetical protein
MIVKLQVKFCLFNLTVDDSMNLDSDHCENNVLDILDSSVPFVARYNQSEMSSNVLFIDSHRHWFESSLVFIKSKQSFKSNVQNFSLLSQVYASFGKSYHRFPIQ